MRYIQYGGPAPSDLCVAETTAPVLRAGTVRVKVAASGVNRADTLQRQGRYPAPPGESDILGLEVSGVVTEVADDVGQWRAGDRVCGLVAGGGYAEEVIVNAHHLLGVPDNISLVDAAGLAEVFLTAYQCLKTIAGIERGQRVLIHAGASGVGLAALQLCRFFGVEAATTASSDDKLAQCRQAGAVLTVNYRQNDFAQVLNEQWPDGVDMVLDMVGGDYLNRNLSVLKRDGHIVCLAMLAGRYADKLDMALLLGKRAKIEGSTLRNRSDDYKTQLVSAFHRDCYSAFASGELSVNVDTVYDAADAATAHQRLEDNQTCGKLLLRW
ncbi:NAD(P)H-quinone oxidoreductase [Alteromonas sp. CYL-A6]|uniref:NAD(P)H-quinone oxidoreductase n=1 Tax=Alteromonas nitratireducens TaxID=3390813 RepID=UPI0034A8B5AE